jgi:hypothetical protein
MSAPGALPRDPVLPHLAHALDEAAMAPVFNQVVSHHGARLESCHLERIKYRPQRNCTLSYRLRLHNTADNSVFEQRVAARLCSTAEAVRRATRAREVPLCPSDAADVAWGRRWTC